MADTTSSPNMGLPVPVVGVDPGPNWADDLNSCLTLIDQHDHSAGSGVQITPSGISINADFSQNSNNLTVVRTTRYIAQSAALALVTDVGCVYVAGVDLYYNDVSGNQIRLTQSGSIVGTAGSITGLVSPASATYVGASSTFVWQSDTNKPANTDTASVLLRNLTVNSKSLTLSPPTAMGSDFTITLPTIPASSQSFVIMDTSGNFTATFPPDNSSVEFGGSVLRVKALGVTKAMLDYQATNLTIQAKTANYTIAVSDSYVAANGSGGAFTLTLPNPVGISGRQLFIERTDDTPANGVTLTGTISGETDWVLYTKGESVSLVSNNVEWVLINHKTLTKISSGAAITFTGSSTNPVKGTTTTDEVRWFRSGQHAYCYYRYVQTVAGTAGSGNYLVTFPNSFVADTTYLTAYTDVSGSSASIRTMATTPLIEGVANVSATATSAILGVPSLYSTTTFRIVGTKNSSSLEPWTDSNYPFSVASLILNSWVKIPVVGWKA